MSQLTATKCKICGGKSYGPYCKLCEYSLIQIDVIISSYLEGTTPRALDEAIIEFDRIYYSNLQLRAFYNTACEAVEQTIWYPNEPLELLEMNFSSIPKPKILTILEKSGVLIQKNDYLYSGPLLKKLLRIRLSGYSTSSDDFSKQLRIIYAVLTMSLAKTLLTEEDFNPNIVLGILRFISSHILTNINEEHIPREIRKSTLKRGLKIVAPRTRRHVEWDLMGLSPNVNPRIFSDYNPEKELYISKESMVYYYEYIRDRIRERDYERNR